MEIGLIDVDGHHFPNLALMKISAYHKSKGDTVEWWNGLKHYNRVYQAKVFDESYTHDNDFVVDCDELIKGGTGYGLSNVLPDEIEHIYPDYSLYRITETAYGFLTRGCPRHCKFCIVGDKEGLISHKVADLSEFWRDQKNIEILDPNILASRQRMELLEQLIYSKAHVNFNQGLDVRFCNKDVIDLLNQIKMNRIHFAWDNYEVNTYKKLAEVRDWLDIRQKDSVVYVLTHFNTSTEEDLDRIYKLKDLGYEPYVMIYDKPHAPKITKDIQRWCNCKWIFHKVDSFEDYKKGEVNNG